MCAKAEDGTHTLMKGDEGINVGEKATKVILLNCIWDAQNCFVNCFFR